MAHQKQTSPCKDSNRASIKNEGNTSERIQKNHGIRKERLTMRSFILPRGWGGVYWTDKSTTTVWLYKYSSKDFQKKIKMQWKIDQSKAYNPSWYGCGMFWLTKNWYKDQNRDIEITSCMTNGRQKQKKDAIETRKFPVKRFLTLNQQI